MKIIHPNCTILEYFRFSSTDFIFLDLQWFHTRVNRSNFQFFEGLLHCALVLHWVECLGSRVLSFEGSEFSVLVSVTRYLPSSSFGLCVCVSVEFGVTLADPIPFTSNGRLTAPLPEGMGIPPALW